MASFVRKAREARAEARMLLLLALALLGLAFVG